MLRLLFIACLLALVPAAPIWAQPPANGTTATAPGISPAQARQVLDTINDPQKRARFTATLEAIVKGLPPPAPTPEPAPAAAPEPASQAPSLAQNGLGADVLVGASDFLNHLSDQTLATLHAVQSVPQLWGWLEVMATDPAASGILLDAAWRLILVLAIAIAVEWAARRALQRPIHALVRRAPTGAPPPEENSVARAEAGDVEPPRRRRIAALTLLLRMPLVLGRLALELLPIVALLLIGHVLAATPLGGSDLPRLVLLAVIDAYAVCVAILCVARMMFSPAEPRLRLLHISDGQAAYAMRWTRRIAVVGVFGYAIAEVGLLLGLSDVAHDALLKTVVLIVHVFLIIIVLQRRRTVRRWLRAPEDAVGIVAVLRNRLARVWHWIAIALLVGLWLVWAVEVPHGYVRSLRYFVSAIVVLMAARLLQIVVLGALDRMLQIHPDVTSRYPGIDARLASYHPVLVSAARGLIFLASAIVLLQLWGLGALDWLATTPLGHHLLSSLVTLLVTLLLALVVWEGVNTAIERHLAKLAREAQVVRSARLRTLLPLLRSTLLITILIVVGMMVLSEIGVNIGPLLAGAGIVGVAIGFGSQKLVQDLITGIFLLLENAMQVGDNVTVSGLSGTVENLSIRTIRLRASDGSVHIIPFSAVTSVTNLNRGLGNASVNVCVAYHEDTDRVGEVLKEIAAGMRQEADFSTRMLSDLQLWGVDKLDGAGVTIAGQVVCTDSGRWSVQREFNRRMKKRFEELGIEIYNPTRRYVEVPPMQGETVPREDSPDEHTDRRSRRSDRG
jgi:small-conductance mechanosensitive channel